MANERLLKSAEFQRSLKSASYQRELTKTIENQLREALNREEALLHQKDDLIQKLELSGQEADHRLLNGMQMIASLLSLQSRSVSNPEVAEQLTIAADRVAMIERVHRRLHYLDRLENVAFKQYLADLCRDLSTMLTLEGKAEPAVAFEGIEVNLPTTIAIPLGFIVSELVTNAVKYGKGRIAVTLKTEPGKGYALSVANDGAILPTGFDAGKGLGMKIVHAFVRQIGGELLVSRRDQDQGARFNVMFSG